MRQIPTTGNSPDRQRKVAEAVNALIRLPSTLGNYANDAAAAAGGVGIGELYRNGSVVMVRVA